MRRPLVLRQQPSDWTSLLTMQAGELVGRYVDSPEVVSFLQTLEGPPVEEDFADFHILDFPRSGFSLYIRPTGTVRTVFLYGEDCEEHRRWAGELPFTLSWSDSLTLVEQRMGPAEAWGESVSGPRSGRPWRRFDLGSVLFHVEFETSDGPITLLTFMQKLRPNSSSVA